MVCCSLGAFTAGCAHGQTASADLPYVVGFCAAAAEFQSESSVLKPEGPWTTDLVDELGTVYGSWADALHDLDPPADIAQFHALLVDEIRAAAARLAQGAAPDQAIYGLGLLTFPENAAVRLGAVADDLDECTIANFHFDAAIGVI